jgi:hypothetical protein
MNALLESGILLAEPSRLETLGRGFQHGSGVSRGNIVLGVFVLVGIVLAVWAAAYWHTHRDRLPWCNDAAKLFWSLCRAHALRWGDRWLLWRVARYQRLDDPARMFLEPQRLDPANLGAVFRTQSARLGAIRARLFAGLSQEEPKKAKPREPADRDTSPQPVARDASPRTAAAQPSSPLLPTCPTPSLDVPPWSESQAGPTPTGPGL